MMLAIWNIIKTVISGCVYIKNELEQYISEIRETPVNRGVETLQKIARTGRSATSKELAWIARDIKLKQNATENNVMFGIRNSDLMFGKPLYDTYVNDWMARMMYYKTKNKAEQIFKQPFVSKE